MGDGGDIWRKNFIQDKDCGNAGSLCLPGNVHTELCFSVKTAEREFECAALRLKIVQLEKGGRHNCFVINDSIFRANALAECMQSFAEIDGDFPKVKAKVEKYQPLDSMKNITHY